jgi:hypothetical protein
MTERDLYLQKDCTRMLSTVLVSTSCTGKDTDLLLPPNGMQDMPNQLQEADNWSRRVPKKAVSQPWKANRIVSMLAKRVMLKLESLNDAQHFPHDVIRFFIHKCSTSPTAMNAISSSHTLARTKRTFIHRHSFNPARNQTTTITLLRPNPTFDMPIGQQETSGVKFVTSTVGNTVGGVTNTLGGVVGALGRGVGETLEGATGSAGRPVARGIADVSTSLEKGANDVAVKRAGEGK